MYAAALPLTALAPAAHSQYATGGYQGYMCLLFGWTTLIGLGWKFFWPWTANVLYLPAAVLWIVRGRRSAFGAALALAGLGVGSLVFRIDTMMVNEAGNTVPVRLGLGAWLWLGSFAVHAAGFLRGDEAGPPRG
jgi:hypothetical protein